MVIPETIEGFMSFSPQNARQNSGFEESFFQHLASVEATNFWFRSRNQLILWALKKYFPSAKSFLEIGCGTGYVLSGIETAFPLFQLYGSEIFAEGLKYASERLKKVELFQMDARNIPFYNEFNVIGAFDVLEHIQEDELVLSQIYSAISEGGGIILTVPQHPFLWSRSDEHACHCRRYTSRELISKVHKAGFKVIKVTSFVSSLFPLMLISRLKKSPAEEYDPMNEFKLNEILNDVFYKILSFENSIIKCGVHLPFGGSLLLIAQKV